MRLATSALTCAFTNQIVRTLPNVIKLKQLRCNVRWGRGRKQRVEYRTMGFVAVRTGACESVFLYGMHVSQNRARESESGTRQ